MKEYRQGDTVRLIVEAQDEHGVHYIAAAALLEGKEASDLNTVHPRHMLDLAGWPEDETTRAEVVLTGEVEQQEPGLYTCYVVVAENDRHALSRHELDPPLQLRIVEHPDDVRKGPEVLSVGELF